MAPRYPRLIPRIFADDPDAVAAFVRSSFGATGDSTPGRPTELRLGSSMLIISGTEERAPQTGFFYLYLPDVDGAYARAVAAGAVSLEEPGDTPYGDRRAMVGDPWGNTWQIATRIR